MPRLRDQLVVHVATHGEALAAPAYGELRQGQADVAQGGVGPKPAAGRLGGHGEGVDRLAPQRGAPFTAHAAAVAVGEARAVGPVVVTVVRSEFLR